MSRRASWPMAGTCSASATPTIRERLAQAIEIFKRTDDVPTLIIVESHIGYGAPHKHDTSAAHGEPLGEEEIRLAKRSYGWPEDAKFLVPDGVREHFQDGMGRRGRSLQNDWSTLFTSYRSKYPDLADRIERMQRRELPEGWDAALPVFAADAKGLATRNSSGKVLNAIASHHPWLIGGAADLAPSTKTRLTFEGAGDLEAGTPGGRNMHFGVREHAMGAILNGLALSKVRALRRGLPDLFRLHEAAHPPCRADGASGHLCLHARFDRRGRGRTDAPAGRAARRVAQHPRTHHAPPRRRQRGRRSVARHHRRSSTSRPVWR